MPQDVGPNYDTFEALTVANVVKTLTAATYGQRAFAVISVETAAVRFKFDADPTASEGHVLEIGDSLELRGSDEVKSIRFIRRDGVSAVLAVSYGW